MHILIIPTTYPYHYNPINGIFFCHQAKALKRAGFQVGVIAPIFRSLRLVTRGFFPFERGISFESEDGIPTYRNHQWDWLSKFGKGNHFLWERAARKLFNQYIHSYGPPDVIHAHEANYAGVFAAKLEREFGIPYVLTEHSSFYARGLIKDWQIYDIKNAFRNASHRVVVSPHLGTILEAKLGSDVHPWISIPNILDARISNNLLLGKESSGGPFRFLNIAFMTKIKGQIELLKAFAMAFMGIDDVHLRFGGDGPLRQELQRLVVELGVGDKVSFLGMLNRDQVLEEMQGCDVFVLPSHYETFGVVLIEALGCGKPVLSTACGGPESIIKPDNGLIVPPGDILALADGLKKMHKMSGTYDPHRIRKDCLARYSEEVVSGQLKDIFIDVVHRSTKDHI
jgi:glycosyltransferase involved in cell wall biosynthesis